VLAELGFAEIGISSNSLSIDFNKGLEIKRIRQDLPKKKLITNQNEVSAVF